MSLFRKAGKTFEKTKQAVLNGDDPAYECTSCEKPVTDEYEYCPHCGEPTVEPVEDDSQNREQ